MHAADETQVDPQSGWPLVLIYLKVVLLVPAALGSFIAGIVVSYVHQEPFANGIHLLPRGGNLAVSWFLIGLLCSWLIGSSLRVIVPPLREMSYKDPYVEIVMRIFGGLYLLTPIIAYALVRWYFAPT